MICKNCNAEMQDGVKFCTNCGKKIENESSENKANASNIASEKPITDVKGKKKVQPKKLLVVLGAFVVVVLGAIIISIAFDNGPEPSFDEDYQTYDDTFDYELNDDTQQLSGYETDENVDAEKSDVEAGDGVSSAFKAALATNDGTEIYNNLIDAMIADVDLDIIDSLLVEKFKEIMKDLDTHDFTDEAKQESQDAVYEYLSDKYEAVLYPTYEGERTLIEAIYEYRERLPESWQFFDEVFGNFIGCVECKCQVIYERNDSADGYTGAILTNTYLIMYTDAEKIENEKYMNMAVEGYKEICTEFLEFRRQKLNESLIQNDYEAAIEVYSDARWQMDLEGDLVIGDELPDEIKNVAESVFEKYAAEFSSRAIDQAQFGNNMDMAKVYAQIACDLAHDNETYKDNYNKYFG